LDQGGGIEVACYNWHHQRERQPFKKGADDVFQHGQAVHTAVHISNHLGTGKPIADEISQKERAEDPLRC